MSTAADQKTRDAARQSLVDVLPEAMRPWARLARLDRPVGIWLLFWPGAWSLALASAASGAAAPDAMLLALFAVGAVVMRAAGCVFNDIVDRDIDARVARTAARPIASGRIGVLPALAFLAVLCLTGLAILLTFNLFAIALGAASILLIAAYPFMKRITWWPQLWLGLTFNWGALLGWAAAEGTLSAAPVALYLGAVLWTVGYDTIYAHQDREDDALIGVRSTARLFGADTKPWLCLFYGGAATAIAAAFAFAGLGWAGWLGLAAFAGHLAWQIAAFDEYDSGGCLRLFKSNRDTGAILFAGILAGGWTA